jgi:transcriptional regulator with XRE-family HTH domain
MASLSEKLKRERELRGISLKQISEETRIGVRFLQALEDDRLDIIPGEFYRRSYLRAYARYLGLDEDRALNVYDFSRKDKTSPGEAESGPGALLNSSSPLRLSSFPLLPVWLKWVGASLGIGLALVLLLRAMPASTGGGEAAPPPAFEREAPVIQEPAAAAAFELQPSPFPAETPPLEGNLRLVLSVEESCWLEIAADGEVVVSGLKDRGFRQEVTALRELRLWLGNAGGVKLLLNDRPGIPLGRSGQVRKDLTITLDNYLDFVSSADRS